MLNSAGITTLGSFLPLPHEQFYFPEPGGLRKGPLQPGLEAEPAGRAGGGQQPDSGHVGNQAVWNKRYLPASKVYGYY